MIQRFAKWWGRAPFYKRFPATVGVGVGLLCGIGASLAAIIMIFVGLWSLIGPWTAVLIVAVLAAAALELGRWMDC